MNCKWEIIDGTTTEAGWCKTKCLRCGHITAPWPANEPGSTHRRHCPLPGWGDYLAHFLVVVFGVSKERFSGWVRLIHNQPSCGCQQRQELVNEAGWWITSAVQKFQAWLTGKLSALVPVQRREDRSSGA